MWALTQRHREERESEGETGNPDGRDRVAQVYIYTTSNSEARVVVQVY